MIYLFELTYDGTTTIVDEPVGWSDVEFVKRRDENFHGVFFEFSSELKFYGEAYKIILDAFNNDDVEAVITFRIYSKKVAWKDFDVLFDGVVLFDTFKYDNQFVIVTLEKDSILRKLKNVIDKQFPIIPNKNVLLHSQPLYYESEFSILDTLTGSSGGETVPALTLVNAELETTVNQSGAIFYNGDTNTRSIRVHGHIKCTTRLLPSNNDRGLRMWVGVKQIAVGSPTWTLVYTDAPNLSSYTHNFNFDTTLSVPFDNNILVKFDDDSFDGQFTTFDFQSGSFIKLTETQEGEANRSVNGVTFYEAFDQICTAYLGNDLFISTALQEADKLHTLVTNAYQLRGIDKPLLMSFKQLLNSVQTLFNVCLSVEDNKVKVSDYADIYDNSTPLVINDHSIIDNNIESKLVFNTIELTYNKFNLSDLPALNGLYEFNTSRSFAINSNKISGKKPLNGDFITAGTAIERLIRRKNETTSSYQEDNDIVIISLNRVSVTTDIYTGTSTTYAVGTVSERNENLSITNVLDGEKTFNIRFSPRRIIAKHLSDYYYLPSCEFEFLSGEGNNDAVIASIPENDNIGTATAYKSPMRIEFETDTVSENTYIEIDSTNYFITEVSSKLNNRSKVIAIKSLI